MLTLKGATLLHVAAEFGQAAIAKLLLDSGADVNTKLLSLTQMVWEDKLQSSMLQRKAVILELSYCVYSFQNKADLTLRCRLPGHYERPEEVFEGTVLDYARQFPGTENQTLEALRRSVHGH